VKKTDREAVAKKHAAEEMLPTTVSPLVMVCWVTTSSDMSLSCHPVIAY